jgi:hypothetical protein
MENHMKVESNTSDIPTAFLRTVFAKVHNHLKKSEGHLRSWKYLKVTVRQSPTKRHCSGYAYYNTGPITLTLARREVVFDDKVYPILTTRKIAWIFYHEVMHVYGYKHKQYSDIPKEELDALCADWPEHPPRIEKKSKPRVDHVAKRATSIDARIEQWGTKLKRAENALKKLKTQKRYYDKKLSEPRPEPKPRKAAKRRGTIWEVAKEHGCLVDQEFGVYMVYPPDALNDPEDDPFGDDHSCDSAKEARRRVMVYASLAEPSPGG